MRDCGILMSVSSLPSPYGIGDLGLEAYAFVDFLRGSGQRYWQVLPIGPTSFGDSPYQSPSVFAGNPYFIDLRGLYADGLLTKEDLENAQCSPGAVDYGRLYRTRLPLLRKAYGRFTGREKEAYVSFCRKNADWLDSYALFRALKELCGMRPHWEWPAEFRDRRGAHVRAFEKEHADEINFERFLQFMFDAQWQQLKAYAHDRGIRIIGDAPIYAAYDSADFWENPREFVTGKDGTASEVAGVPPDYFSADGQLWGNPLYDWTYAKAHGYDFWIRRIRRAFDLYDVLRIDHFRGFSAYYCVSADSCTAKEGTWKQGPGKALFDAVENALGKKQIIAEDLGVDSEDVRKLLRDCGYPGMKVVQFGFDGDYERNAHALPNFTANNVGYTGTHDNDTAEGWFAALGEEAQLRVKRILHMKKKDNDIAKAMIHALYASEVRTAVVPIQDWLRQGSESRVNVPGTREGNWQYRLTQLPGKDLQEEMLVTACKYDRMADSEK